MIKTREELLIELVNAVGADSVAKVIEEAEKGPLNIGWKPYGGNTANRSIINAQQSNANAALVELITNAFDAISERRCRELGYDPKTSPNLPSVSEICDEFFLGDREYMNKYATVRSIADSNEPWSPTKRNYPDIVIADNGTGQTPDKFESTFLSLSNGTRNKQNVPFQIGTFNMGSTGSIRYCGNGESTAYKFISTRRHSGMNENLSEEELSKISFTMIRQTRTPNEDYIEYMVIDGKIPYITTDISDQIKRNYYLQIDEPCTNRKERFINDAKNKKAKFLDKGGTLIKLYSYQTTTPGVFDSELPVDMNSRLYAPVYNLFCCENRPYSRDCRNTTVYGNYYRFSKGGQLESHIRFSKTIDVEALLDNVKCKIPITIYVLDKSTKDNRHLNNIGLCYVLNGQVQYSKTNTFISNSKYLGFTALRGYLLVVVDCTDIKKGNFFMASRESIADTQTTRDLHEAIINTLRNDEDLLALNKEYTSEYTSNSSNNVLDHMAQYLNGSGIEELKLASSKSGIRVNAKKASVGTSSKSKTAKSKCSAFKRTPDKESGTVRKINILDSGLRIPLSDIYEDFFDIEGEKVVIEVNNKKNPTEKETITITGKDKYKRTPETSHIFNYSHIFNANGMELGLSPANCKKDDVFQVYVHVESIYPKFRQEATLEAHVIRKSSQMPFAVLNAYKEESKVNELGGKERNVISWSEVSKNGDWLLPEEKQNIVIKENATNSNKIEAIVINMDSDILKSMVNKFTRAFHHTADEIANLYVTTIISDVNYLYKTISQITEDSVADFLSKNMSSDDYNAKLVSKIDADLFLKRSSI